jgi:four helix bundle protein
VFGRYGQPGDIGVTTVRQQVRGYKDLIAWQNAIELVTEVYRATMAFPGHEIYGLINQMRRASVSIASNIAEGHGRATPGEFVQFLCQARGSLRELETQVIIACNLSYLTSQQGQTLLARIDELARILNGLIVAIQRRRI